MGDVAEVNFDDDPRKQEKDELKPKLVSVDSAISDIEAQIRQLSLAEQNSQVENLTADISSDLSPNASLRHQPAVTATSPPPVTQSHQPIAAATSPPPLTPSPQPLACLSHPILLCTVRHRVSHTANQWKMGVVRAVGPPGTSLLEFPSRRDFALGMK